jgi:hypothetical protein
VVLFWSPPQNADKSSNRNRNATNRRDRILMDFALPWLVHDMESTSQETQRRNQGHANEQRSDETEKKLAIH